MFLHCLGSNHYYYYCYYYCFYPKLKEKEIFCLIFLLSSPSIQQMSCFESLRENTHSHYSAKSFSLYLLIYVQFGNAKLHAWTILLLLLLLQLLLLLLLLLLLHLYFLRLFYQKVLDKCELYLLFVVVWFQAIYNW